MYSCARHMLGLVLDLIRSRILITVMQTITATRYRHLEDRGSIEAHFPHMHVKNKHTERKHALISSGLSSFNIKVQPHNRNEFSHQIKTLSTLIKITTTEMPQLGNSQYEPHWSYSYTC